jgi:NtrC-family two-component system sensor histidine kinase KinB
MSQLDAFRFLYELSREVIKLREVDSMLQRLVQCSCDFYRADATSVIWLEPDGTQVFRAVEGRSAGTLLGLKFPQGEGISGWVAQHGESLWVPDVSLDQRFFSAVDANTGFETKAILAAPIFRQDVVVAVFEIVNPSVNIEEVPSFVIDALTSLAGDALEGCAVAVQALRYHEVFASSTQPCCLFTAEGNLLDINLAARKLFNIGQDHILQYSFDDMGISDSRFLELIHRDEANFSWDFHRVGESGRDHRLLLVPIQIAGTAHYLLTAFDISEFISMEETRLQLFNMLVHDLRVPLSSIHHSIELVMAAWQDHDATIPMGQVLEIASRSEHRMERLISDILDTTCLDAQTRTLDVMTIDITRLVQDAINAVKPAAQRRNHTFNTDIRAGVLHLQGDLDLLQRVLINILGNAVKYTPDGGEIDVSVYDDAQNVYFTVSDNGPGILPSDEEHIFDLFFRGRTSRVKGAGIGLAFSKLAVEAHGGAIWLDREVTHGARFVFSIPKQLPDSAVVIED